jgi:hypothetical protein
MERRQWASLSNALDANARCTVCHIVPTTGEQSMSTVPRVSRLSVGRLCNLGNYEHIRYEVTVEIPEGVDVTATLKTLETALNTLAVRPPSSWEYQHAKDMLAKPEEALAPHERANLEGYKRTVERMDNWQRKQEYARALLGDFSLSSEFTDHKQGWDDDAPF